MPDLTILTTNLNSLLGATVAFVTLAAPPTAYVVAKFRRLCSTLDDVRAQLYPNGGGSLRDAISRIDHRLARASGMQRAVIDAAGTAVFETDANGDLIWASTGFLQLVDRQLSDVLGDGWTLMVQQDERPGMVAEWESAVGNSRRFEWVFRMVTRTGSSFPVSVSAVPVDGGWLGVVTLKPNPLA